MKHAILSPSNAEKWSNCPGAIQMEQQAVAEFTGEDSNVYADTGTVAHMIAEVCLKYNKDVHVQFGNMQENIQKYLDYVQQLRSPYSHWKIEGKIEIFEGCWGTADLVVFDRDELHIVDLKYGTGIVKAEDNLQMLLYAYGTLEDHHKHVTMHIVMPRGKNSTWTLARDEVIEKAETLIPKGKAALDPNDLTLNKTTKGCQWCKARTMCPEKNKDILEAF